MASASDGEGVRFPEGGDGRRSTGATGRAIFADCVRNVDPALTARIEHTRDWRSGYLRPLRDVVAAAAVSPSAALAVSRDGLDSAHRRFRFVRAGVDRSLDEAMAEYRTPGFGSVTVEGRMPIERDLSLPYRGKRLFGSDLRAQIDPWVAEGIAEPSFGVALHTLMDNPEWLDLRDVDIALLGAAAEMGPTRSLLRWGARVHAVDLPRPEAWQRLIDIARNTAGSLRVPIRLDEAGTGPLVLDGVIHPEDDTAVAEVAGADLLTEAPELRTWLASIPGPFVLGTYVYADGATHVQLSMAADAIAADLLAAGTDITLAYLATPTDVFMVPMEAVEESRRRWQARGVTGTLQSPLRLLNQFQPNYPDTLFTGSGIEVGLNDSLVPQLRPRQAPPALAGPECAIGRHPSFSQPCSRDPHPVGGEESSAVCGVRRRRTFRHRGIRARNVHSTHGRPPRSRPSQPELRSRPIDPPGQSDGPVCPGCQSRRPVAGRLLTEVGSRHRRAPRHVRVTRLTAPRTSGVHCSPARTMPECLSFRNIDPWRSRSSAR